MCINMQKLYAILVGSQTPEAHHCPAEGTSQADDLQRPFLMIINIK